MAGEYLKSSVHVHSKLCDGKNTLEEMAVTAWRAGLQTLGFSGHSPVRHAVTAISSGVFLPSHNLE